MKKTTRVKPAAKPARKPAAPRRAASEPVEHRLVISGIAVAVAYEPGRTEQFELVGTAIVNASQPDAMVRTTGTAVLVAGKGANHVAYRPASLTSNLVLTVHVDPSDLKLLRDVFVTGTGSEATDPGLILWARTAASFTADTGDDRPVTAFGFRLDFTPPPLGPR